MAASEPCPSAQHDANGPWSWYHIIVTTYGAWLPGDPRGFRTRHHRQHVEGDYKDPPPGAFGGLEEVCRDSMRHPAVSLPAHVRPLVGRGIQERLQQLGGLVVCVAVTSSHAHVLVKTPAGRARDWMGLAKKHVWALLHQAGWTNKLWGKRGREIRIRSRVHQLRAYHYILRHESVGAWIWKWSGSP